MRIILLAIVDLISTSVMAQDPIPLPGFADMDAKGEVNVEHLDSSTIRETAEFAIRFTLGLSDGIQPMTA